jgi:hypothetical protein
VPAGQIGATTGTPTDIAFSQQVRAQLLNSQAGNSLGAAGNGLTSQMLSGVQISANNGVVTLRGTVRSRAEQQLLDNQIRRMSGVRAVVDSLTVGPVASGQPTTPVPNATGTGTSATGTQIPQP